MINGEFSYKDRSEIIFIPNFKLSKGDKISIMGESGQGKTTILNILSGTRKLKAGKVFFDGNYTENQRPDIVYISQDVELFDMSIRENLTLGKDISDEILFEMLNEVGMKEWYEALENGLDEIIGEKGVKLSAGQRQRLNLIRGVLINKDVYFFDEPTSALDKESEEKIIKMLNKYLKEKTYIIVTHREGIKKICNKHFVFENHMMREVL